MTENERKHTVLIVEDDAHTRELLVFTMEDAGHLALSACNGLEALMLLDKRVIDIIICDIMMPGMNGFALREALLSRPKLRDIGFIFLSAKSMPEDEIKGLRYGVDEYITKPFNPDVLAARVDAVLTRRETLARAAQLDPLTQLYNRQAGEREVRRELERIQRYPSVAALAFVDIDDFKEINDAHLHVVGDRALVSLAEVFKQNIRSVDIAARYGGDEFVLFFPETGEEEAVRIIERMQRHLQRVFAKENHVLITFSAGVAEAPRDGDRFEVLSERADQAMYTAKRGGKARVLPWRQHMKAGARRVWTI